MREREKRKKRKNITLKKITAACQQNDKTSPDTNALRWLDIAHTRCTYGSNRSVSDFISKVEHTQNKILLNRTLTKAPFYEGATAQYMNIISRSNHICNGIYYTHYSIEQYNGFPGMEQIFFVRIQLAMKFRSWLYPNNRIFFFVVEPVMFWHWT